MAGVTIWLRVACKAVFQGLPGEEEVADLVGEPVPCKPRTDQILLSAVLL